ncbi:MAG: cofactor-independent phosphoglycerate mutase [Deltaproteobacteria bacterium]|nr:cofactor-independent phosphoglycerate mutase [Deltaproteobacteria bacterium]
MKYVVLLGDGMSDRPLEDHGGKTPLQIASTPAMDALAAHGQLGLARTIPDGMPPGSDVANMAVLGYDPVQYYTGRSPIEAASIGICLAGTDIAFRCNLVTLAGQDGGLVMQDYSAGHICNADAEAIIAALKERFDSDEIMFYAGVSYRHCMIWHRGKDAMVTTPPHDISDKTVAPYLPSGDGAEKINAIMDGARGVLAGLGKSANAIWLWGQGRALKIPPFESVYGRRGSVISAVDLVKGLGICAGMSSVDVPGATGYLDTNYQGKVAATLRALETDDFVYLHVEAPDEAGHKGSFAEKVQAIEDFDAQVVQPVIEGLKQKFGRYRVLLMPDHPTPLAIKTHTDEPVPFVLYDAADAEKEPAAVGYNEPDAAATGLVVEKGWELMKQLISM